MAKFIYKRLKRHPGLWRLDGIGTIRDRGRLGASANIYFSEITENELANAYRRQGRTEVTLSMAVHTATLSEFRVGSIWRDGKFLHSAPKEEAPYTIDISQCRYIKLDEAIDLNGTIVDTIVPDYQYRLGDNREQLANTYYAVLPVLGDPLTKWMVIPCSELLRFYYGVTSRLLSSTLRGRLDDYIWRDHCRFEDSKVFLRVKQRINRVEATVLGRMIASNETEAAMRNVHNHLSSIQANNKSVSRDEAKPLTLHARFPFSDKTVLAVHGKRIKVAKARLNEKYDQWGVFAMEILRCTHPLGFATVTQESDEPWPDSSAPGGGGDIPPSTLQPNFDDKPEELEVVDGAANANLKRLAILRFSNPFAAMDSLRFEHVRPQGGSNVSRPSGATDIPVDTLSFGEGSHEEDAKNTLGAGTYQHHVDHVDRDITLFLKMLQCMRQKTQSKSWLITTRALENHLAEENELIALFPLKIGKRRTWHLIADQYGNERPRQVVIAEIHLGSREKIFYLLEMELKPGESGQCTILLHTQNFSEIENKTFETLFRLTAMQNRWIAPDNKWKPKQKVEEQAAKNFFSNHEMHRINHPAVQRKKTPNATDQPPPKLAPAVWAEALMEKIGEVFSLDLASDPNE